MRGWRGRQGASDAGLRDARADADGREATSRCCVLGWTTDPKPGRLRDVTLLGGPISLRCWKYIPIKQVFEAGHIHFQNLIRRRLEEEI